MDCSDWSGVFLISWSKPDIVAQKMILKMISLIRSVFFLGGAVLIASSLTAGCAIVPGLHVGVSADDSGDPRFYEVVEITPDVIAGQGVEALKPVSDLTAVAAADPAQPPQEYIIGPGDVLQVVVWDHPELNNPFGAINRDPVSAGQLVAADGTISFPYVGTLQVAGQTVQTVREQLALGLKSVVAKPQVDVRIAAFRANRVQVTGEVKAPGIVAIDDTIKGVLEAINERGGLNAGTASRRSALLIRNGTRYTVDLAGLLSGSRPALNPKLQAGDIVHVPDTSDDQIFVLGEVEKQGAVVLSQQRLTLIEALTKAGGLGKTTADDSGVLVFRRPRMAGEVAQIYALDMQKPRGLLLAGEFSLSPRDVVYVKATKFAQYNLIIKELLPTITTIYQLDRLTN